MGQEQPVATPNRPGPGPLNFSRPPRDGQFFFFRVFVFPPVLSPLARRGVATELRQKMHSRTGFLSRAQTGHPLFYALALSHSPNRIHFRDDRTRSENNNFMRVRRTICIVRAVPYFSWRRTRFFRGFFSLLSLYIYFTPVPSFVFAFRRVRRARGPMPRPPRPWKRPRAARRPRGKTIIIIKQRKKKPFLKRRLRGETQRCNNK